MRIPPAGSTMRRAATLVGVAALLVPVLGCPVVVADPQGECAEGAPSPARAAATLAGPHADKDFDGDSYADLVIATPAALYVLFGSPVGLRAERRQILGLAAVAGQRPLGPDATFGESSATADFDGDGFADLAVWIEDRNDMPTAHGLHLIPGSAQGLDLTRHTYRAFPRRSRYVDLASGNFGRGRYPDLGIGDQQYRRGKQRIGAVHVLYGGREGVTGAQLQTWTPGTPGVRGAAKTDESFGSTLVADDFGRGGYDDLAIGIPTRMDDDSRTPGAVQVLYGSPDGLTSKGDQLWSQDTPGLRVPRDGTDFLGDALAAGHYAGGQEADLAMGSVYSGAVIVVYGSPDGLQVAGNQLWTQKGRRIKGRFGYDYFGASLATANFGKDRDGGVYDDLAIGSPENKSSTGAVHILYGSHRGLTSTGDQRWAQSSSGIPGIREEGDRFGTNLAAADFGSAVSTGRYADLAVASPAEGIAGKYAAGLVHVLYGTSGGLHVDGVQVFAEDRLGGEVREYDEGGVGWFLAASTR